MKSSAVGDSGCTWFSCIASRGDRWDLLGTLRAATAVGTPCKLQIVVT